MPSIYVAFFFSAFLALCSLCAAIVFGLGVILGFPTICPLFILASYSAIALTVFSLASVIFIYYFERRR